MNSLQEAQDQCLAIECFLTFPMTETSEPSAIISVQYAQQLSYYFVC